MITLEVAKENSDITGLGAHRLVVRLTRSHFYSDTGACCLSYRGIRSMCGVSGRRSSTRSGRPRNWRAQAVFMITKVRSWSTRDHQGSCGTSVTSVVLACWGMSALIAASTRAEVLVDRGCAECLSWKTLGVEVFQPHFSDARIIASPWSAQIRGAVSVHQGSLTL
jgi:hypothetical protein